MEQANSTIELVAPESHDRDEHLEAETRLVGEITQLWADHVSTQNSARHTTEGLRLIRRKLGERLYQAKRLVARPGCHGGWSSFLALRGIPRATADRLAQRYERSIAPAENRLSETISVEDAVHKLFGAIWPRIAKVLTTKHALGLFIACLSTAFEGSANEQAVQIPALTTSPEAQADAALESMAFCSDAVAAAVMPGLEMREL